MTFSEWINPLKNPLIIFPTAIILILVTGILLQLITGNQDIVLQSDTFEGNGAIPIDFIEIYSKEQYNISCESLENIFSINISDAVNCSIEISHHPLENNT